MVRKEEKNMKKEIYRLWIHPLFKITIVLSFVITLFLPIYFGFHTESPPTNIYDQGIIDYVYNSVEDIQRHLIRTREELDDLDPEDPFYHYEKENLEKRLILYDYLMENYIPYEDLAEFSIIAYDVTESYYSFHAHILGYLFFVIIFITFICNYILFSVDFEQSSYKYIYIQGNRKKTIFQKTLLVFLVTLSCAILMSVIVSVYDAVLYHNDFQEVLIFSNDHIQKMSAGVFAVWDSLSFIYDSTIVVLWMIGLFIFVRKSIYAFLGILFYLVVLETKNNFISNHMISSLSALPIYAYQTGYLWPNLIFNLALSTMIYMIGLLKFLKTDL